MAELAIGISKTAVEALLNKVKTAIKEEAEQLQIVERDISFIKDEFEMMQSFLIKASSGEGMKNQVARTWVRQVRDLSYDTEDCIDYVVLHLDKKRSFLQRLLRFNMLQKPLTLDQAVAEIKRLRARAEEVNQRNMRYNQIGNSKEQVQQTTAANQMVLDIIKKPTDAFDNQEDILDLTRLIKMEDKGLQVISVCGTGGDLGVISIIKKTYEDPEICKMFECRAWVKLVRPFNPHEFIRSLLAGFYANSPSQEPELGSGNSHINGGPGKRLFSILTLAEFAKKLVGTQDVHFLGAKVLETMKATQDNINTDYMEIIKKKAYLIVLEDLSSIEEWNAIKTFMPDLRNGSRIVVSTQQLEIASLCPEQTNHGLLREFSTDHSVYAFFKALPRKHQHTRRKPPCPDVQIFRLPPPDHWEQHHNLYGRESEIKILGTQITSAHARKVSAVISVCGIAGVGKSFLVRAYFDHFAACFGSSAVVSASRPFDIMNFCQDLVDDLKPPEGEDIFHRIWKHLEEKQCLIIIDDLRSKEDWDLIEGKLILRASKSCIIVITREESVARHCATSDHAVCRVKGLEAEAARSLFEKETKDHGGTFRWDSNMLDEAGIIINKCGRLPKLSVALVKYLADVRNGILEARRLNANFMYSLNNSKGLDSFQDIFAWIYSNFQACPQLLKKCVFYLSLFTQSSMIRQSRLVRRWIAEGYSEGTDSNSKVEYTEKLLHELANLGITEHPHQTPTVAGCQINSLFLEYVISRETEENIFLPLEVSVLQGEGSLNTQRVGQHLAIGSSWKRDKFVFDNMDLSRLRSLTVSREWRPFLISDRMRVLRVLDLEDTNVADGDIEQVVKQLPRLKFLGLRRCTKISCLPESLGDDLRQLQTLDIRHTSVTKLPKSITKLQKLQYIRAATSLRLMDEEPSTPWRTSHGHVDACNGIIVPRGIGALMALHTLGVVNIGAGGGKAILNELKYLSQLKKLGVSGINRSNIKGLLSAIFGHSHLESLSLQLHKDDKDLEWLGKITPPNNLQRLKAYVHVVKYPHWSYLQGLGQLKRLHTLSLRFETDQDVELQFCDNLDRNRSSTHRQFSELKVLEIVCSSNLHVMFAGGEMFELKVLKVHCSTGASLQLSRIERLHSLKYVWLKGSFDDTTKEELRRKVTQHPNKPNWKLD
ncbi:hypothetical protein SETIT_8G187600v2 [Setaria italica]|uniref:NB-ARC domain-containing protein n=3 Tax=Setaria italica TaxID=4555 RepID=A0A368S9I0_SETIT|nr:hypothetical protein SETIT_8G187600v2 [Setaria italica]